jgi:hypothetical protein
LLLVAWKAPAGVVGNGAKLLPTRRSTRSSLGPEVVAKKIDAKLLARHGVKREVGSPALAAGPAGAGSAGTARPMAPQPKAQAPDSP